jgi:hypothetical protein
VVTARQAGVDHLKNGSLLAAAAASGFDALITVDRSLQYQQNQRVLPLSVIVLRAVSNDIDDLRPLVPQVLAALASMQPRTVIVIPPLG